jgi:hypothetical protein
MRLESFGDVFALIFILIPLAVCYWIYRLLDKLTLGLVGKVARPLVDRFLRWDDRRRERLTP